MLKETLKEALIELCKSNSVHYEVTAQEISNMRLALLTLEGVNVKEMLDVESLYRKWEDMSKAVKDLLRQKDILTFQLLQLQDKINEKEAKLKEKNKKETPVRDCVSHK